MHKLIFLLIILLTANQTFAQVLNLKEITEPVVISSNTQIASDISLLTILNFNYLSATDSSLISKTVNQYNTASKLTSHTTYSWDKFNINYIKEEKETYQYDEQGNKTEYIYWYGDGDWIENQKKYWQYNQNNMETKYILVGMDMNSNFDTLEIHRTEYNEIGNILNKTDSIKQFINNTFKWDITKTTHFYDENQNDTTINQYKQNQATNDWVVSYSTHNKYDTQNHLTETYSTDGVNMGNKLVYHYNSEGYLDTTFSYRPIPDGDSIIWQLNVKIEFTYTAEGWISKTLIWNYNQQQGEMVKTRQTNTTYNANGDEIEIIQMLDAGFDKGLLNFGKSNFEYDDSGNLIEESYFTWLENKQTWLLQTQQTRTYKDGLLKVVTFNNNGYNFPAGRDFYFYNNEKVTGTPVVETTNAEIFPNPATDFIWVTNPANQFQQIAIYSAIGQLIYKSELNSTRKTIAVSYFKPGNYIAVFKNKSISKSIKFLKQ